MANKKLLSATKTIIRITMLYLIAWVFISTGIFYERYKEPQQTFIQYFTTSKTLDTSNQESINYALEATGFYNNIIKLIWICLILSSIIMALDYWIDRDNHFITKLKERAKNVRIQDNS